MCKTSLSCRRYTHSTDPDKVGREDMWQDQPIYPQVTPYLTAHTVQSSIQAADSPGNRDKIPSFFSFSSFQSSHSCVTQFPFLTDKHSTTAWALSSALFGLTLAKIHLIAPVLCLFPSPRAYSLWVKKVK